MNFFGVGPAEAGLVFVITLIVVGPQRFPEIMRNAGRWYRIARAYSNEVMRDVRSAVDDIEREVRAETDDLTSVRELTDLGKDLKAVQQDAEAIGRDANTALRTESAPDAKPSIRPSQRQTADPIANATPAQSGDPIEAVPPIEQPAATATTSTTSTTAPQKAPEPAAPTVSSFDPFKKAPPKKGPVLIPRESVSSEGDERKQ